MKSGSTSAKSNNQTPPYAMRLKISRCAGLIAMAAFVGIAVAPGCKDDDKLKVSDRISAASMPSMSTVNVSTLISDSGITQYKIVSPLWNVYDEVDTPYWAFPKGIYLRKYDRNFKVIASVAADSAKFFRLQNLWKLDGNVELKKEPGELFLTQQLFWDQRRNKIYSDSFIHIENPQRMLEGYGFQSNDRLTEYSILKPTGIFPVNDDFPH